MRKFYSKIPLISGGITLPHIRPIKVSIQGEAVVVDLGKGHYLFALLRWRDNNKFNAKHIAFQTMRDLLPKWQGYRKLDADDRGRAMTKDTSEALENLRVSRTLTQEPLFVTFSDINKPEAIKVIEPYDMLSAFPTGAFTSLDITDISLELVNKQPITKKLESVLKWWAIRELRSLAKIPKRDRFSQEARPIEEKVLPQFFKVPVK